MCLPGPSQECSPSPSRCVHHARVTESHLCTSMLDVHWMLQALESQGHKKVYDSRLELDHI